MKSDELRIYMANVLRRLDVVGLEQQRRQEVLAEGSGVGDGVG